MKKFFPLSISISEDFEEKFTQFTRLVQLDEVLKRSVHSKKISLVSFKIKQLITQYVNNTNIKETVIKYTPTTYSKDSTRRIYNILISDDFEPTLIAFDKIIKEKLKVMGRGERVNERVRNIAIRGLISSYVTKHKDRILNLSEAKDANVS